VGNVRQATIARQAVASRLTAAIAGNGRTTYEAVNARPQEVRMPVRLKKLIGTVVLVALVVVYALLATLFAVATLGAASPWVHLLYFLLTGMLWIVPAMFVIRWMITPSPGRTD
jgi:hypothetical protein